MGQVSAFVASEEIFYSGERISFCVLKGDLPSDNAKEKNNGNWRRGGQTGGVGRNALLPCTPKR